MRIKNMLRAILTSTLLTFAAVAFMAGMPFNG
jgi:hypothetical protein